MQARLAIYANVAESSQTMWVTSPPSFSCHCDSSCPFRIALGDGLLEEILFIYAAWEAVHIERPALHMGDHDISYSGIVIDEVSLGYAVPGEEDLVLVGDLQCMKAYLDLGLLRQ